MDRDIAGSLANLAGAQKQLGHTWTNFGTEESRESGKWMNPAKKTMYNFAPELDHNIKDSIKNLSDTEVNMKHKYNLSLLQMESDPICSSSGCDQYKHPDSKEVSYP